MEKISQKIVVGLLSILLAGCLQEQIIETATPEVTIISVTATETTFPSPSATPINTRSPSPQSPTKTSTPTPVPEEPTIVPEARLDIRCLQIVEDFPPAVEVSGGIVFSGGYQNYFIWNLESGDHIPLPKNAYLDFSPSPDGRLMAFSELEEEKIGWVRIVTPTGQLERSFPWEDGWFRLIGWLDNEHLMIDREAERLHTTVILDLGSGQAQEYSNDHPNAYYIDAPYKGWGGNSYTAASYSPNLDRAVYLGLSSDSSDVSYIIWDIKEEKIVSEIITPANDAFNQPPIWSASGDGFIVAYSMREIKLIGFIPDDELYWITRDGEITRLTNLSAHFAIGTDIRNYNPSPDGRYIAFWLAGNPPAEYHDRIMELAVLDLQTEEVTSYCVKGDFRQGGLQPIWSPNSKQLLIESESNNGKTDILLVDIERGVAVKITEELQPFGWLATSD